MKRLSGFALLAAVLLSACGNVATTGVGSEPSPRSTPTAKAEDTNKRGDRQLVEASTQFSFAMLSRLHEPDKGRNLFFSPFSIFLALGMTYNGASGDTEQAMAKALFLRELPKSQMNEAALRLRQGLQREEKGVELRIANSLWARQEITFLPQFLEVNRRYFGAQISAIDFSDPSAPELINQWVSENTKGKIKQIVDRIPPDAVMYLLNAVYFNGKWTQPFDKALTQPHPFRLVSGERKQVAMMSREGRFEYLQGEDFQMVSLPYGAGRFRMVIALPSEGKSLGQWLSGVDAKRWQEWLMRLSPAEGELKLPRFQMSYEQTLNEALKQMGMGVAFEPERADFRGMREHRDLYIQKVHHKAVVEVNEEGTEAAAITSVQIGITAAPMPRPRFQMVVDRPFFFIIQDGQSGAILFMGAVYEPE